MIDLHTHSTFSDGSLTPADLARKGLASGLSALALTDHDSLNGIPEFLDTCRVIGLRGIPGVEISAEFGPGTFHMLGYFLTPGQVELDHVLASIRGGREDRNLLILRKLNDLGLKLTWEEVAAFAGEDVVGRPHFAQAMQARGYVKSKQEAFDRYLAKGQPAYLDRLRLSPEESLRVIRQAGGIAVLAHPATLQYGKSQLRAYVENLCTLGLAGIETYYSEHSPEQQAQYLQLAQELGLVVTGGSDFHGDTNPNIMLGRGFGQLAVPDELIPIFYAKAGRQLE